MCTSLPHGFSTRLIAPILAIATVSLLLVGMGQPAHAQFTVTAFNAASVFDTNTAAMDITLGLTGFQIEDFEDVNLLPGLSVQFVNPNAGPVSTLPSVFVPGSIQPPFNTGQEIWDGTHVLVNQADQLPTPFASSFPNIADLFFQYPSGAQVFAVGLSDFESQNAITDLVVNGTVVGQIDQFAGYLNGKPFRNLYVKIAANNPATNPITSVGFQMRRNTGTFGVDYQFFDHLAISPVPVSAAAPEPAAGVLVGAFGLCLLAGVCRRAQARCH